MKISDIDFNDEHMIPLANRKSISFLLGAGFSAPKGYPIGKDINDGLLNFDDKDIDFSPMGKLATSEDGQKPQFQVNGIRNPHQKYFDFCKKLIKEYAIAHGEFDYEQFYDFIKSNEVKESRYQVLCDDLVSEFENFDKFISQVPHIYNQMVAHLLKDADGKNCYDDEPFKFNVKGYDGFLNCLSQLSCEYIINVHTLNHDLLFESFNNTTYLNRDPNESLKDNISDGFDEYGSEYYGSLIHDNRTYLCRLERYTGRYNTPIRLFKLHGSLDYVPFYRKAKNGFMIPDKYVKIKWGIGAGDIMKSRKSKMGYDLSPSEYHADFLTGTTFKIQRYNEPLLFKKLFKKFKNNLKRADKLIIIGYGCKDKCINEIIKECFDYQHKPSFIVDIKPSDKVKEFGKEINAKIYNTDIDLIEKNLFDTMQCANSG